MLLDAAMSSSNHPYISKECYDILQQQYMSIIAAHPHDSYAERLPEILNFA